MLFISCLSGCIVPMSRRAEYEARQQRLGTIEKSDNGNYWLYKVKNQDSLFKVAMQQDVTVQQLATWNRLAPPYHIYPGDVLVIREKYKSFRSPASNRLIRVKKNSLATRRQKNIQATHKSPNNASGKRIVSPQSIRWVWPVSGSIVSYFALDNRSQSNKGIDIAAEPGTFVNAAADGEVVYTGNGLRGYGDLVIIRHAHDFLSAYGHNQKIFVKEGDYVKAGKKIAEIGSSGTDTYKLHFEIRQAGTPVNPLNYLPEKN